MAEVFLILLFLLLLTTVSYSALVEVRVEKIEERLAHSEELVRRLRNSNAELQRLNIKRYGALDLSREIVEAKVQLKEREYEFDLLSTRAHDLEAQLSHAQDIIQMGEDVWDLLRQDHEELDYEDVPKYIADMRHKLSSALSEVSLIRAETAKVKSKLFSLSKRAGIDNFCWYEEVTEDDGSVREKGIKLFDIRIWNKRLEVVVALPQRYRQQYGHRYTALPLDFSQVNGFYNDSEFLSKFKSLYEHGISGLVEGQPAECRFQVWVWDNTGKRNKIGFKRKMRVVESYFYKLNVLDERWPHHPL